MKDEQARLPANPGARAPGSPLLRVLENPVGLLVAALLVLLLLGLLAGLSKYAPSRSPSSAPAGSFRAPAGRSGASHHLTGSEQLGRSD
ncbi:MAG: hypothetical protein LC772_00095 [Chloroflexi bacterium]|nr:hypothetical protein [Chloroflexota bacterium]